MRKVLTEGGARAAIVASRSGLPATMLVSLARHYGISRQHAYRLVGMRPATADRKIRHRERLPPEASERLTRIAQIEGEAIDVLGSEEAEATDAPQAIPAPQRFLGSESQSRCQPAPILPPMKSRWFITLLLIVVLTGCASTWQTEAAWQTVHMVDVLQTLNGPARDECFYEANPLTAAMIGRHPSERDVLAWGVGLAAAHAGFTYVLERTDAPRWLRQGWHTLSITSSAGSVAHNHRLGMRPWGNNLPAHDCDRSLKP